MTWILDARPLIVLARADHLDVLTAAAETCVIPSTVYAEVVETGLSEGYPDARRVERAVESGRFAVEERPDSTLYDELSSSQALSSADAAVLALAADRNEIAVMDEQAGRSIAAAEGITTRGTAYVVLQQATHGRLSVTDARTVVDDVVDAGWHCSTDLYAEIVRKLDALE